jgi:hypothetical protein
LRTRLDMLAARQALFRVAQAVFPSTRFHIIARAIRTAPDAQGL